MQDRYFQRWYIYTKRILYLLPRQPLLERTRAISIRTVQGSAPPIFIVWEWWEIQKKNNQLIIHSFLVKFQLIRENELIDISARLSTITYQVLWSWIISFLLGIVVYFATYFYEHLHTISHISVFFKSFLNADVRWLIKRLKYFFVWLLNVDVLSSISKVLTTKWHLHPDAISDPL